MVGSASMSAPFCAGVLSFLAYLANVRNLTVQYNAALWAVAR